MQKTIFAFPDPESLWQFKNETRAVNIAVTPKKNTISGLFDQGEIEMAVKKFKAVAIPQNESSDTYHLNHSRTGWLRNYLVNYGASMRKLKTVFASIPLKFL